MGLGLRVSFFSFSESPRLSRPFLDFHFFDLLRLFAGASGAKLDVSGPALRGALNVILQVPLVPNSICLAGAPGAKLDA